MPLFVQENSTGVTEETALRIMEFQPRCIICGSTYNLHIHHRLFRSEEGILEKFLQEAIKIYFKCYQKELKIWQLNDIQNLCRLCELCHEENKVGVHGGNEKLRQFLRNSFTCPISGFNIPFYKKKTLLW